MDQFRPPPPSLPMRAWFFCFVLAVVLLLRGGASSDDVLRFFVGLNPLGPDGQSAVHVLLKRALMSFGLITLALTIGLSFALAGAMLVSRLGGRVSRFTGWLSSALASVPPMAWALGAIYFLIRVRHLSVETLLPLPATAGDDSGMMHLARALWSWLVPALVLAIPVFGTAIFSLTHRLSALLDNPKLVELKARGLNHSQIVFRHLVPQLRVHLARMARPCAAMLLAFAVPVEELLGFNGWGLFVAAKLKETGTNSAALASALWMGGWMLAGCLGWLGLLEKKGLPPLAEETPESAHGSSRAAMFSGTGIAAILIASPWWAMSYNLWPIFAEAHAAWVFELLRAVLVSLGALLLVLLCGPAMCLMRSWKWILNRGMAATMNVIPLLLVLLLIEHGAERNWFIITLAAAIPGIAAYRDKFRDVEQSTLADAAHVLGQRGFALWWHHVLPGAIPGLLSGAVRNIANVLLMLAVLDYFSATGTTSSWGALMRVHADNILDDPLPALTPAFTLALWCVSFRLLSRGFRTEYPPPTTTSFPA